MVERAAGGKSFTNIRCVIWLNLYSETTLDHLGGPKGVPRGSEGENSQSNGWYQKIMMEGAAGEKSCTNNSCKIWLNIYFETPWDHLGDPQEVLRSYGASLGQTAQTFNEGNAALHKDETHRSARAAKFWPGFTFLPHFATKPSSSAHSDPILTHLKQSTGTLIGFSSLGKV